MKAPTNRHEGAVLSTLDALGYGGLILDALGRVVQTNERAARYLGLDLEVRRRSSDEAGVSATALQQALRGALRNASAASPLLGYIIALPRTTQRPILLRSIQVAGSDDSPSDRIVAIVLLDLEQCPQPDDLVLQQVFGLTPAETRLAKRLTGGEDLSSISEDFGVKIGTLRMQLKAIFWKTGTRRQAELVALLAHMARLSAA
jgi:DNA-binding CsgD family transcriptional regulator